MRRLTTFLLLAGALLAARVRAMDLQLHAQVDKDHVQLGESIVYQVSLQLNGQSSFTPQLQTPEFQQQGFQVRSGPQQQQNVSWVNGVVTQNVTISWQIMAIKSGDLTLGPCVVRLKDPAQGEITRRSETLTIHVEKAGAFVIPPTPTAVAPESTPTPLPPQADGLRPIRPDMPFPWAQVAGLGALAAGLLGFMAWLALRRPKPKAAPVVRNPGQVALYELEQARRLLAEGKGPEYFRQVSRVLRSYLGVRLGMFQGEPTLLEFKRRGAAYLKERQAGEEALQASGEALDELVLVLFAKHQPTAGEEEAFPDKARALVLAFEKAAERDKGK